MFCEEINPSNIYFTNEMKAATEDYKELSQGKFISPFMITEGMGCTFTAKVRNMEYAGASVAIIVNTNNMDVDDFVMMDDGQGAGIRIPSMLISYSEGMKLINFIKNASP